MLITVNITGNQAEMGRLFAGLSFIKDIPHVAEPAPAPLAAAPVAAPVADLPVAAAPLAIAAPVADAPAAAPVEPVTKKGPGRPAGSTKKAIEPAAPVAPTKPAQGTFAEAMDDIATKGDDLNANVKTDGLTDLIGSVTAENVTGPKVTNAAMLKAIPASGTYDLAGIKSLMNAAHSVLGVEGVMDGLKAVGARKFTDMTAEAWPKLATLLIGKVAAHEAGANAVI